MDENRSIRELSQTLAACDDIDLIQDFLCEALLTPNETKEIANRWALVKLIREGMSQRKIAEKLGLSLCKITRGSKELKKEDSPFERMLQIYEKNR